ncbi:MAG: hypothetical protein AB7P49_14390 [Bdellovibrionales bacterium]
MSRSGQLPIANERAQAPLSWDSRERFTCTVEGRAPRQGAAFGARSRLRNVNQAEAG